MIIKIGDQTIDLRPFLVAAVVWAGISVFGIQFVFKGDAAALQTWAIFYSLSLTDLFFLVKTIAATLLLMSDQGAEKRSAYAIQAIVFGGLKLLCLGMIIIFLWKFPDKSSTGVLIGLSGLIVVPLAGGFWWSQRLLKEESPKSAR